MRAQSDDKEDINNKGDGLMDKKREVKEKKRGGKKRPKNKDGSSNLNNSKAKAKPLLMLPRHPN